MDRKIGKILVLLIYASSLYAVYDKSLVVTLTDLAHNKISQAEVNVPCLLHVTAHNIDYTSNPEGFGSWQNITVSMYSQSNSMTSVNGVTSKKTTFIYAMTPHQKGAFVLPPLSITDAHSGVIKSEKVRIVVDDAIQVQQQTTRQAKILQLDLNSKVVYVGQKVSAYLRFGYTEAFENLRIIQPMMDNIHLGYMSDMGRLGSLTFGNLSYQTQDFLMELYPEKIGTLVIPSFQATFTPVLDSSNNVAHLFTIMMGSQHTIQSQPRSLEVQALPASTEFAGVTAIGQFDRCDFTLSSQEGKVGEGLVAKMIVEGDGNLEIVKAPALKMPEGLYYYEGNSKVQRLENGRFRKEYEWIVQSDREGDFAIPVQKFAYFDVVLHRYAVVESKAHSLMIRGGSIDLVKKSSEILSEQHANKELLDMQTSKVEQHMNSRSNLLDNMLQSLTSLQNSIVSSILTLGIGFLTSLLMLLLCLLFLKNYFKEMFFMQTLRYRIQFFMYRRNKDTKGMYHLFETVMKKYGLELQSEQLHQYFIKLGLPEESFGNWQNFVSMILEINFSKEQVIEQKDLAFSLAKEWFPIILTCCKMHKSSRASKQVIS